MIEVYIGETKVKYLTVKEAAHRYGLSESWFKSRRIAKEAPHHSKINGKGKAYYNMKMTDEWFANNIKTEE